MAEIPRTTINEITGDLFASPVSHALVHCVSEDLAMGKGIAVEFKKRFSSVTALKKQQKKVGEVAWIKLTANQLANFASAAGIPEPEGGFQDRYIYYMITKARYFHKPTMEDFSKSLAELRLLIESHAVSDVSMPRIGCGLDKLDWKVVKQLISTTFADLPITINVYSL